jgi:hypothetical protein
VGFFSAISRRQKQVEIDETPVSNIDEKSIQRININNKKMKDFVIKAIGGIQRHSDERERFQRPEYNLWEIKEASESDSYVKIAFSKYSYLIYKAGASLKGEDERVAYLEKRFRMMSFMTQKPMDILFQEIADDLVKYSNAFLIKKRVDGIVGINARPMLADKVVGGYFRVDPASIKIKRDKNGNVLKYEQGYGDNIREFFPRDVIHFYMDKDANNAYGTPRVVAALEDVKLLRKIEGNVTALIYRFSMPLYQWIVGLPQQGMQATQPEILKAQNEIERSTLDGIVVTNERTAIKAIGAEGSALNAEGYLRYFEERVFSALGVSASQMGRGGAKQDSESMEAQIHDTVKYIQRIMAIFIQEKILNELLLEGGFNPILNEEDIVSYEFEEISLETKVKKENHEMLKFQSNVIPFEETRRNMGMKDTVSDESRLYKNMIDKQADLEKIDRTAEHQKELSRINSQNNSSSGNNGPSTGNKAPRSNKSQGPNKAVSTNNRPQNQHGTHSAKIKEGLELDNHKKKFKDLFQNYDLACEDLENGEDLEIITSILKNALVASLNDIVDKYSMQAIVDATEEINAVNKTNKLLPEKSINLEDFYEESEIAFKKLVKTLKNAIEENNNDYSAAFEKYEYKLRFISDFIVRKAYWYSYAKTGALLDVKQAYIIFNSEKDAEGRNDKIDTKAFTVDDIPAYHSFCDCEITYNKEKAGEEKKDGNRN